MKTKYVLDSDLSRDISLAQLNKFFQNSYPAKRSLLSLVLYWLWVSLGLTTLTAIAWFEPFSARFSDWLIGIGAAAWMVNYCFVPLIMVLRAVLMVEVVGYAYHRFFQHVGLLTRCAQVFRKNQKYHWHHHMIVYPIGSVYKRARSYIASEKGVGWSWVIPGILVSTLFVLSHGLSLGSLVFISALGGYAKFVISTSHSRFHVIEHPWVKSNYFHWLEDIHVLHHWDQRYNFTIIHPLMDILFGTYLSPSRHKAELAIAYVEDGLTVSDLINWRYLLFEATPEERAMFISHARYHRKSKEKFDLIMSLLARQVAFNKDDTIAARMYARGKALLPLLERK